MSLENAQIIIGAIRDVISGKMPIGIGSSGELTKRAVYNKPGVYLSADEVNRALNSNLEILPDADNPHRNAI